MHLELVGEIRRWTKGLANDEPLFPRLAKRKAYTMVQRDLEEAGIAYETEEGFADFHAAGRHTHTTELLRTSYRNRVKSSNDLTAIVAVRQGCRNLARGPSR